jgi:hypothetical protein
MFVAVVDAEDRKGHSTEDVGRRGSESLTYVTSLAVWATNHCPGAQFTSSYNLYDFLTYSGLLHSYLRDRRHKCHHRYPRTRDFADTG